MVDVHVILGIDGSILRTEREEGRKEGEGGRESERARERGGVVWREREREKAAESGQSYDHLVSIILHFLPLSS